LKSVALKQAAAEAKVLVGVEVEESALAHLLGILRVS